MPGFASLHEEVTYKFSRRILGRQFLFTPENFGQSKEPADLAWVTSECTILFYMTELSRSFKKAEKHNLGQMYGWMKKWQAGQRLVMNESIRREFKYEDVENVIAISVVKSSFGLCSCRKDYIINDKSKKLIGCVTITDSILTELANNGAGPLDLLDIVNFIIGQKVPTVHESVTLEYFRAKIERAIEAADPDKVARLSPKHRSIPSYEEMMYSFAYLRESNNNNIVISSAINDLDVEDIIWFCYVPIAMEAILAPPGAVGPLCVISLRENDQCAHSIVGLADIGYYERNANKIPVSSKPGIQLIVYMALGSVGRMMAVRTSEEKTRLRLSVDRLRSNSADTYS